MPKSLLLSVAAVAIAAIGCQSNPSTSAQAERRERPAQSPRYTTTETNQDAELVKAQIVRRVAAETAIRQYLPAAIESFRSDVGEYPRNMDELVNRPQGSRGQRWEGPYVRAAALRDWWGQSYRYAAPGKINRDSFDLISAGPSRLFGDGDDLSFDPAEYKQPAQQPNRRVSRR